MTSNAVAHSRRNVAAMARQHADKAIQTLVNGLDDPDPRIRIDCANKLLDRGIGKPTQPISGDDDADPISLVHKIQRVIVDTNAPNQDSPDIQATPEGSPV